MKKSLEEGNHGCVKDYLYLINEYLETINECYKTNFEPAYKETKDLCKRVAKDIGNKSVKAKNRKVTARAVGGTAAGVLMAGGVGTGIVVSIVAESSHLG